MSRYNVIDLFAGVGGLSYGFSELPEFDIIAANEIERDIAEAYRINHSGVYMIDRDIKEIDSKLLANILNGRKIDLIVGGPPCQSYSTLGKRCMDDRANLFMQYKRILKILMSDAFVFENVVGILSMNVLLSQLQIEMIGETVVLDPNIPVRSFSIIARKTGIDYIHILVNKSCCEFAEYYEISIVLTRELKPQDKELVKADKILILNDKGHLEKANKRIENAKITKMAMAILTRR
mgnify:CR=1 FL=1